MSQRHPIQNEVIMLITTNIRCRRRIFLNEGYAREAVEALYRVQDLYAFYIYAFVIMPDHVHLLVKVPENGFVSSIVRSYKRAVSHAIAKGPLWQPRFHIRIPASAAEARRYIHLNPVRAELVNCPENYRWSSACGLWDIRDFEDT